MSVIVLFYFLSIILQPFNEPLLIRKVSIKFHKFLFVIMLLLNMLRKYSLIHFLLRATHLFLCFLYSVFIFRGMVFTKFISKSTSGKNFFLKVSGHCKSLFTPCELLFQRCMIIYDVMKVLVKKT